MCNDGSADLDDLVARRKSRAAGQLLSGGTGKLIGGMWKLGKRVFYRTAKTIVFF